MSDNLPPAPLHFSQAPVEGRGRGLALDAIWVQDRLCVSGKHLLQLPLVWDRVPFEFSPFVILEGWTILLLPVKLIAIWGIACYQVIVPPANHTGSGACCSSSLLILSTSFAERA